MSQRIDFYKASPDAIKAMMGLEQRVTKSGLDKSLVDLVRLRASQINGCAYCMDMHTADARKAGENDKEACGHMGSTVLEYVVMFLPI